MQVAQKLRDTGDLKGADEHELEVREISGLLHDKGKTDPRCFKYRLRRSLAPKEKEQVRKHPIYSAEILMQYLPHLNPEAARVLWEALPIILWHHKPAMIDRSWQRAIAFELTLLDTLISMSEDRWWKGVPLLTAVEALPDIVKEDRDQQYPMHQFGDEITAALDLIMSRYRLEEALEKEIERRLQERGRGND